MKYTLFLIFILSSFLISGQESEKFTLDSCFKGAVKNYPNYKQIQLNKDVMELNTRSIQNTFYPKLNLNGNASYQSEVTQIPFSAPGFEIEPLSKDWYSVNLDIEQMIYDGGLTSSRKQLESTTQQMNNQKVAIEVYQLKEKVNQLFFTIIFFNKNLEILEILRKNLEVQIKDAESAFANGVLLQSDVDVLKVEYYNAQQQITAMQEDLSGLMGSLNELTGFNIQFANQLLLPDVVIENFNFENNRPEYVMFGMQQTQLSQMKSVKEVKRRPIFLAYGQAGYGRPGYDMLNNNFDGYYKVGARLQWDIWDWSDVKREKKVLDLQGEIIGTQKETFDQNLKASLFQRKAEINKYEKLIETDQLISKLQENVVKTAEYQFKDGTITSTNYVIEINKLVKAKLKLEADKLQFIYAKYQYLTAIGNL